MKKVFLKDSIKMFKNNLFRYICIIIILVLGIAFFIGMNTVAPAMKTTTEKYLKDQNIYDISFISNLGYTQEDVNKFSENENICEAQGIYTYDVLASFNEKDIAVRLMSNNNETNINNNNIIEGRDIKNDNECLMPSKLCNMYGYNIGDKIKFYRQDNSKVEDNLKYSEFEIVGKTLSPIYISIFYGNTNLLNGELNSFIVVKESAFKMKTYTTVYVKTNIDKNISKFSEEYKEKLDELLPEIEEINTNIINEKYENLYKQADSDIKKGEQNLINVNNYLVEAKYKIKASQLELNDNIVQISKIISGFYNTDILYSKILEKKDSISKLYKSLQELENENSVLGEDVSNLVKQTISLKDELSKLENNIDKNLYEIYELTDENSKFVELNKKVNERYYEYYNKNESYKKTEEEYKLKKKELEENQKRITKIKEQINRKQQDFYNSFLSIQDLAGGTNNIEISKRIIVINKAKEELIENENILKKNNLEEKINNVKTTLNEKKDELSKFKTITEVTPLYNNNGFKSLKDDLEKIAIMGRIFPVMFFVVVALVTVTTITRMIEEDRKNIGLFKALGYEKKTIMKRYIVYSLTAALIGFLIGTALGSTVIVNILYESYCSLYDLPNLNFFINITYTFIALFISFFATVFFAIIITIKELKENAAILMRQKVERVGKNILLEKIPFIWKRLSFLNKICFRNIFRYKRRLFMTLVGIAGCTALIYSGLGLQSAVNDIGKKQFKDIRKFSMEVFLTKEVEQSEIQHIKEYIEKQNYIKETTPVVQQTTTIEANDKKKDVFFIAIDGNDAENYLGLRQRKNQEKIDLNDDGIIVTEKLANIFNLNVGDKIKIENEGTNMSIKVIGITENYLYNYIYMTPKMYERIFEKSIKYNEILVNTNEKLSEENQISLSDKLKENDLIASTVFEENIEKEFKSSLNGLTTIVILFIACASLLAFVVLINLNNINIEERSRELATIKLLGFYKNELESYVFRETIILSLLGTLFGLLLGMGILGINIQSAEVETIFLAKDINVIHLGVSAVLTMLFTLITNLLMKKKIKNINMITSLKSVE